MATCLVTGGAGSLGSTSEIVFEALPTDDPQVRQPDTTLARDLLSWKPEVSLRDGLARTIELAETEALVGGRR
jgi:dTDP-glucose 4,6-dehydratase